MPILYVFFLGMGKELPSICCCLQTRTWHDLYTIRQNCQTWRRRTNHWQDTENKFKPVVSDIQLNSLRSEKVCPFSRISRTDIPIVSISWNRKAICSSFIYGRGFFAVFRQRGIGEFLKPWVVGLFCILGLSFGIFFSSEIEQIQHKIRHFCPNLFYYFLLLNFQKVFTEFSGNVFLSSYDFCLIVFWKTAKKIPG